MELPPPDSYRIGELLVHCQSRSRSSHWRSKIGPYPKSGYVRIAVRVQQIDATLACSLLAGVWNSKVFRGRWLRRSAILSSSDCV